MKQLFTLISMTIALQFAACTSILETEEQIFVISGTVVPSELNGSVGDHFYVHGFKESSSRRNDRFEFTKIVDINSSGNFNFSYESTLSDRQARLTGRNYIIISGKPLIENPEVLDWNRDYNDITLSLNFN